MSLTDNESEHLHSRIGRSPTETELHMVAAEWSEHCSYKSSKLHLSMLPTKGPMVVQEKGYDSGVLDVGGGYVVTVHIESHNHPSAVEPYGGAATGVGGVIRDILSTGTRPIAILDGLRFGDPKADPHAGWLFRNAVAGIADYGNCLGIPTIGGETEFDECYSGYALVDVAAIGFGRKDRLIRNRAECGDAIVLLGGPTGRDGIGGSQFASDQLESEDRSAVQIPDPFMEKLVIEAVLEARNEGLIHAMKDLGGGGLSCAVSETADALSVGIQIDVDLVHTREQDMSPHEVMTSESQERMLIITPPSKLGRLREICAKFGVACSAIGTVTFDGMVRVRGGGVTLADVPACVVANAQLLRRKAARPAYLDRLADDSSIGPPDDLGRTILDMLTCPNIASKEWVYGQYDHEVGIRTVVRPGHDAAVLRLDNGKFLAAKLDANPKQCYIDPYAGAVGCFEEACRNVACTGATPIGMVDHLQFGNPENPEIFWTFLESLRGIADHARRTGIPCVGGKVSFYNETPRGPIKPTPVIGVLGLADHAPLSPQKAKSGDTLVMVGRTRNELGGSEYAERIHGVIGGNIPRVEPAESCTNMAAVLSAIHGGMVRRAHDCSKGGLAVAASEICMDSHVGCSISPEVVPGEKLPDYQTLFSETHSRYLLVVPEADLTRLGEHLGKAGATHAAIGRFGGDQIVIESDHTTHLSVDKARAAWSSSLGGGI